MKMSLGLKIGTSLSLTPQLQQAIRLLQLSSLELEQEIQVQLDSNPLLEVIDDQPESAASDEYLPEQAHASDYADQTDVDVQMAESRLDVELPVDTQWDDVFSHQSTALASPEFEEREDNRCAEQTIVDHLLWQLNLSPFSAVDRLIAQCIIDAIDDRGYLIAEMDELLDAVNQQLADVEEIEPVEQDEVEMVLKRIQHFDPVGVAARNLSECLSLQLRALPERVVERAAALRVLQHHELLVSNELARLLRATQLTEPELQAALLLIKSLDPYPGLKFQSNDDSHQVPDVIVRQKTGRWEVQLNTDILPKLRVNPFYAGMIKRADQSADNQYLRQNMQEARNFIKSIDERHKTLLKVATCIVEHQRAFLEHGPEAMRPLILRDIADETELHESTVSRVTTQKFMLTPRGLFELKYFFSSHVGTSTGGECSSTAIRAMIKKMISEENPRKPLSDNVIAENLQATGIDVARRTVAKYRESLNIASSSERKRLI